MRTDDAAHSKLNRTILGQSAHIQMGRMRPGILRVEWRYVDYRASASNNDVAKIHFAYIPYARLAIEHL